MATIKELSIGRSDVFIVPLSITTVEDGFNIREDYGDIAALCASIRANGIKTPLLGHKDKDDRFVVDSGHRRRKAALMGAEQIAKELKVATGEDKARLKAELENCERVPVQCEKAGIPPVERVFDLFTMNDGKPLTILEEASGFKRLMESHQVSDKEIIRRTGRSKTHVANCFLLLNGGCPELLEGVRKGTFAASLAIELVRKTPDKAEQARMVKDAIEAAAKAGKTTATAKHLNDTDRERVAPSKSKKKAAAKKESEKEVLSVKKPFDIVSVKLPAKCGAKAHVLVSKVSNQHKEVKGFAFGIQVQYAPSKGFAGTEPEAGAVLFGTKPEATTEGLKCVLDEFLAARRTDKSGTLKVKWDAAIAQLRKTTGIPEPEEKKEKAKAKDGPEEGESLVPDATGDAVKHIIALRDVAKKKGAHGERYKALNFIADYFGGRYTPEQFEKFFTEFLEGKD